MKSINCNNSTSKRVTFMPNDGTIYVFAEQDREYWFTVGHYQTVRGAKNAARKQLLALGYTFDEAELAALVIE